MIHMKNVKKERKTENLSYDMVKRTKGRKAGVGWGLEDVGKMGRKGLRQGNGITGNQNWGHIWDSKPAR